VTSFVPRLGQLYERLQHRLNVETSGRYFKSLINEVLQ
jgi:hypothetical protein